MEAIIAFFKYCTIINCSILIGSFIIFAFCSDFSYKNNKWIFSGTKEEFKKTTYTIMMYYKMIIIVFNIVPYIALILIHCSI
tara:strand:+ start:39 stop:284 length:246 start_codon:yes stop_codon:yes gene_type:complete